MKSINGDFQNNKTKTYTPDETSGVSISNCNSKTTIVAAIIRSFNRLNESTTQHSYTTLESDKISALFHRLYKILSNFNFNLKNSISPEHSKKIFDDLLEHITTMQTPSIELLNTLHSMEELLHGSDHLKKVESALLQSGILK